MEMPEATDTRLSKDHMPRECGFQQPEGGCQECSAIPHPHEPTKQRTLASGHSICMISKHVPAPDLMQGYQESAQ